MKKLILASLLSSLLFIAPQSFANKNVAVSLCDYVAADDKKRMRSFLKSNKLKIRNIFDSVQCNGQNLLEFAGNNNAVETGKLIISKLPKAVVSTQLTLIQSSELSNVAQQRINS
jgi:hypothetical protein